MKAITDQEKERERKKADIEKARRKKEGDLHDKKVIRK